MLCISNSAPAASSPAPLVKPDSGPWDAGNGFEFRRKTRQSVSGIACPARAGERVCLIVFDEGIEGRYSILKGSALVPESEPVMLLKSGRELDAEAAATDGKFFYVTGSHSVKRSSCAANPDSRHVVRFRVDPHTGRALRESEGQAKGSLMGYADSGELWKIMSSVAVLKDYVGKCLGTLPLEENNKLTGQLGVNIEGLAVKDGRLYFGFRGPAERGSAPILSVDAEALFSGRDARPIATKIALGERRGIRDLHAVNDGFLVLAGPDDDELSEQADWLIAFWNGKFSKRSIAKAKPLARLDVSKVAMRACDDKLKPEALAVINETRKYYKVVILSDGMCDGGPLAFTIPR